MHNDQSPDVVYANVSHVIGHRDYNSSTDENDIGLLRLSSEVKYTDTILPICLPSSNVNLDQFKVCVDTGFGNRAWGGLFHLYFTFLYHHYTLPLLTVSYRKVLVPLGLCMKFEL